MAEHGAKNPAPENKAVPDGAAEQKSLAQVTQDFANVGIGLGGIGGLAAGAAALKGKGGGATGAEQTPQGTDQGQAPLPPHRIWDQFRACWAPR